MYGGFGAGGQSFDAAAAAATESSMLGGMAKAVGSALLAPLAAVTGSSVMAPLHSSSSNSSFQHAASNFDPAQSAFPMLPRWRGTAQELLQPIAFASDDRAQPAASSLHHQRQQSKLLSAAVASQQSALSSQALSSILNSPMFLDETEPDPPPFYLTPLPPPFNESVESVKALMKEYNARSHIAGEYLVYTAHHGSWLHPLSNSNANNATMQQAKSHSAAASSLISTTSAAARDSAAAEKIALAQLAECRALVPASYFEKDFSVAQQALVFYEQQLAAAAAEAEAEDADAAAAAADGGNTGASASALGLPSGSPARSGQSSASSFFSSYSSLPPTGASSRTSGSAGAQSAAAQDSTYFQAAWAATHLPSQARYSPESIGIVPGVVGAVLVTPAKAAASLYKVFTRVTGAGAGPTGPTGLKSPSSLSWPIRTSDPLA